MEAIKIDSYGNVLLDTFQGFTVWVDVWADGDELICDWNKYIFFRNSLEDMQIKKFQDNPENFEIASLLAIDFYKKHKGITK